MPSAFDNTVAFDGTADLHAALTERLGWLHTLARHLVTDENEARDLVQDTVVQALDRPPALDRPLEPWLARVLRRLHLQGLRRRIRRDRRERDAVDPAEVPDPAVVTERLDLVEHLVAAMRRLPEPYRTTLALRYEQRLEPKEIARRLRVPGGTVRWRLREGLAMLRAELDQKHGSRAAWVPLMVAIANTAPATPFAFGGIAVATTLIVIAAVTAIAWWAMKTPPDQTPVATINTPEAEPASEERSIEETERAEVAAEQPKLEESTKQPRVAKPQSERVLRGRVLSQDGLPAIAANVVAIPSAPIAFARETGSIGARPRRAESITDSRGGFVLEGLRDEAVQVAVLDGTHVEAISAPIRPEVAAFDGFEIVLRMRHADSLPPKLQAEPRPQPEPRRIEVRGFVDDETKHVRARHGFTADQVAMRDGFRVLWRAPRDEPVAVLADGRFELRVVTTGVLGIELLDADGHSRGVFPIEDDTAGELEFATPPLATLLGRVSIDPSESLPPRVVRISNGDEVIREAELARDGSYRFVDLAPGGYELRLSARAAADPDTIVFYTDAPKAYGPDVHLAAGRENTHDIDRNIRPCVAGRLLVDGELPRTWHVELLELQAKHGTGRIGAIPLDDSGQFRVRVRRPGRYRVLVTPRNGERRASTFACIIDAQPNVQPFEITHQTCQATGRWEGPRPANPLWLRTELATGVWITPVHVDRDGSLRAPQAAPGHAELVEAPYAVAAFRTTKVISSVELPRDGRADLKFP